MSVKYCSFNTELGWVVVGGSEKGLRFTTLPRPSRRAALAGVNELISDAVEDSHAFGDLPLRFRRYFQGNSVDFPDRLDYGEATPFQQAVWNAARSIPYGEMRSYSWVARHTGRPRACRAVGTAMARNHWPVIVPCHRVIACSGGLGGFSGGLELKRRLLDIEGALADTASSLPRRR